MTTALTVVTYHYVRPIAGSAHPRINGLELDRFRSQLQYIDRYYRFVTMDQVVAAAAGAPLPDRSLLLTFDDGYADHARYVFPVLHERRIQGAFYAPSGAVLERRTLDVNKIHFVLASTDATAELVTVLDTAVEAARPRDDILAPEAYRAAHWTAGRWDAPEVVYVKRMLQQALPADLRAQIVDDLFRRFVTDDERSFADDLYVSVEDLAKMVDGGMHVGAHGYAHGWLDHLDERAQAEDIGRSLELLAAIGLDTDRFTFCYPYGRRSSTTVELLRARGCVAAFTTEVGLASLPLAEPLEIPRIDTNDLPVEPAAPSSAWTIQAGATS